MKMQKLKGNTSFLWEQNKTEKSKVFLVFKFLSALFVFYFLLLPSAALAHVVKSEGSIGAILHVDPGDEPAAGEQSTIFLEFKDTAGKLNLSNCDCRIVIKVGDKEILNQSFEGAENSLLSGVIPVTFPEKNIYIMTVTGTPKLADEFSPFKLEYDIRVATDKTQTAAATKNENWWKAHIIYLAGAGLILLFFIGALISQGKKRIAVIILVLLILSHMVPVKAIHAAHDPLISHESYACCLPQTALIPSLPEVFEPLVTVNSENNQEQVNKRAEMRNFYSNRSPP
jgi:hypothetical protein